MADLENKRNFIYVEVSNNPLKKVENSKLLETIINPITGKPYDGIILEGECVSIDVLNNNNRIYTEENYIEYLSILKKQIFSDKGVYGELEHPQSYAVDTKFISHKLLDVWYDKSLKKGFIRIMLLNTPNGKIAREIVESGGQLAISARAAGEEIDGKNGQKIAKVTLLVTYDIVYHPGFSTAVLNFVNLNECYGFNMTKPPSNRLNMKLYEDSIPTLNIMYDEFLKTPNTNSCFLEWIHDNKYDVNTNKLNESQQNEEELDQQKIQKNETNDEDQIQNQLQKATQQDLNQQQKIMFGQMNKSKNILGKKVKDQSKTIYDNSAGFLETSGSIGIE